MRGDQRRDVEVRQHVAVENDRRFVEPVEHVPDRAGRAERLGLADDLEPDALAGHPVGERSERIREVASEQHGLGDAVAAHQVQLVLEERSVADRQQRFRDRVGERP
jgi:hypothetical protein